MNKALRNPMTYVLFMLPVLLLYILFFIYPMIDAFAKGFTKWNGIGTASYNGLKNFEKAFTDDKFWNSVKNNGLFHFVLGFRTSTGNRIFLSFDQQCKKTQGIIQNDRIYPLCHVNCGSRYIVEFHLRA